MSVLVVLAVVVTLGAAVRSTWSPCGESMLSSITPLAEQGRGHRYRSTAAWFVLGAALGGLTLGVAMGALAGAVGLLGLSSGLALALGAVLALGAAAIDAGFRGLRIPGHTRQVNEDWLDQYRSWVYGVGFGWQIGVGVATYITTAAVWLMVALAALSGSWMVGLALGALFGLTRGLAVLLGARLTNPGALVAFHRRFDAWREPVRRLLVVLQLAAALVAALAVGPVMAIAIAGAGFVVVRGSRTFVPHPRVEVQKAA